MLGSRIWTEKENEMRMKITIRHQQKVLVIKEFEADKDGDIKNAVSDAFDEARKLSNVPMWDCETIIDKA